MQFLGKPLSLIFFLGLGFASSIYAQTATFSGRVTDQSSGQGVSGVAVVAAGNLTGTRVAVTDSQGNYSLSLGANTNIKLRAYKPTYTFNPLIIGFVSTGPAINGALTQNFSGSSFPILIFGLPPILLTEDNSLNAFLLDNLIRTRDPFPITTNEYFVSDKRTRLTLLLVDLDVYANQGETLSIISAQARDAQNISYALVVEDLRKVPGVPWMSQLKVRLPPELAGVSSATLTVTARGQVSNAAMISLK
jgi:hypothetical protein